MSNTIVNEISKMNIQDPEKPNPVVEVDTGKELINKLLKSINQKKKINLIAYVDDPSCDKHTSTIPDHQESPKRTKIIRKALEMYGFTKLMERTGSISIRKSDLTIVHDKDYVENVFTCGRYNKPVSLPAPSSETSMESIESLEAILAASASVMGGVDTICGKYEVDNKNERYKSNRLRKVFCNVRPPGHHAHVKKGAGFCFMNNVVIGAKFAMTKYKSFIKKVLIFDWDLHHGDGTEDIVKNDPNIMYVSFHRGGTEEKDQFYPFTGTQFKNELGNIYNFPIAADETVESYMEKFNQFMDLAYAFGPDMVMISAGFDSHKDDLYHALPLDYIHFHEMTKSLAKLADTCANGRLISVLEGGYTLGVLYRSVLVHIATLIDGY